MCNMSNRRSSLSRLFPLALVALAVFGLAAPAGAADQPVGHCPTPVFGGYWSEFVDHWLGQLKHQNGVVLFALGVGAVSLFIITRGKWKK
jgi:hypothetical protein